MYIKESQNPLQVLTDSKPCVEAYQKLRRGKFSASARVSSFLSCLSEYNVEICHLRGEGNVSSDFGSRNPNVCTDPNCQICSFVSDTVEAVVKVVTVQDILLGHASMPFMNKAAWKSAQQSCSILRKVYAHLTSGTRPSRKSSSQSRDAKRYLSVCTVDESGLLIVRKSDPHAILRRLIVVPKDILHGLITALHLFFSHPSAHQLQQLFKRYFYGIRSDDMIKSICSECHQCKSLIKVPREILTQSSSPPPVAPGQQFAADVIKRNKQCIFTVRDVHTSFTNAEIINSEQAADLRSALICGTANLRTSQCVIRVDNAPGFLPLRSDEQLSSRGITLDFGRIKNPNKNPVAEKCNQELETELLRLDPSGSPVSEITLQDAIHFLNTRVRNRGLSAKELLYCRDQVTLQPLTVVDADMSTQQMNIRDQNHLPSAISKGKRGTSQSLNLSDRITCTHQT